MAGIVHGLGLSAYLTRRPRYKEATIYLGVMTLLSGVLVYFSITSKNSTLLYLAVTLNGFSNLGVFSTAFELAVETTYPIGEATSGGFVNFITNIMQFLSILGMTPILKLKTPNSVFISTLILLMMPLLAIIFACFAKV